ncbi:MAG: hypothetical protein CMI16_11380 [Opitutaceae bacterium]|nr:hypothetical protein [Opitutaceae bacterium]|tara:strand:+ start:1871 stop:2245 length:375 start_codon:yes stop_codon:yes gene_type:complete
MRRAFTITTLCFAWLCANGALWDSAQVFAWGKMIHDYSQTMPLSTAIEKTFDGSAPCEICVVVEDAQQQEPAQKMERSSSDKVLLAYHPTEAVVIEAPTYSWPGAIDLTGQLRTESVPLRPPRV